MRGKTIWDAVPHPIRAWFQALRDAMPPYQYINGHLADKRIGSDGKHRIIIRSARIVVDEITFNTLTIGEYLRVRYTRNGLAVNIDRYVSSADNGQMEH